MQKKKLDKQKINNFLYLNIKLRKLLVAKYKIDSGKTAHEDLAENASENAVD